MNSMRHLIAIVATCDKRAMTEAMEVNGTRIHEPATRRQFLGLLNRYRLLRGFVDGQRNIVYAWDAMTEVHPDIARALWHGDNTEYGVPVQLDARGIAIRPHGLDTDNVRLMYRELINTPVLKVLYGGMPPIHLDDEEMEDRDLTGLGWEDPTDFERAQQSTNYWPEERWTAWRRRWGSY
jgi:hypothetical protein